jgi:Fe2+ transport system protein FeoA
MKMRVVENAECILKGYKKVDNFSKRLIQMGVLPGAHLKIIRIGPMGNTVEVMIDDGQNIALRITELKNINCQLIAIPLSALTDSAGKKFRVIKFAGGKGFIEKMKGRDLDISSVFEILDSYPFKLRLENGKVITVGRGESEKIIVEPEENG